MELINADRLAQRIGLAPSFQPLFIRPAKLLVIPNDSGVLGRCFEKESVGIGLQADPAVLIANFEFVMRSFGHTRNKDFPNAGQAEGAHLVDAPIPSVEIADNDDPLRVWSPDGETG